MHIGMYAYVLYIFLNLIMSIIPTLYFFVEFVSELKSSFKKMIYKMCSEDKRVSSRGYLEG